MFNHFPTKSRENLGPNIWPKAGEISIWWNFATKITMFDGQSRKISFLPQPNIWYICSPSMNH
jgi:hypothetical protein